MIPKKVHVAWKSKDVVNDSSDLIQNGLKSLVALNPTWFLEVSTDDEIDAYLVEQLGPSYALVKNTGIVAKTDIWRLLKMFNEGGLYVDIDRFCNVELDTLLTSETKWVLPTCEDLDFSQDFMMSAPGNPAFANAIDLYLSRRSQGEVNVYFLGAQTYMHAVTYTLFGEMINTNPGKDVFDSMRAEISKIPFITTYRESPPYDTVLYHGDVSLSVWEAQKRKFYAANSVRHWTGEW